MRGKIKISALVIAVIILLQTMIIPCVAASEINSDDYENDGNIKVDTIFTGISDLPSFLNYLNTVESVYPSGIYNAENGTAVLQGGDYLNTSVTVGEAGLYAMRITYRTVESLGQYPAVSVLINGKIPYREAAAINLMRRWQDAEKSDKILTNDVIPEQTEVFEKQTVYLRDTVKYYGGILYFYLNKGENKVSIYQDSESIEIFDIIFENPQTAPSYKDAIGSITGQKYTGDPVKIEGENALYKSDASLYALNDASSAGVSPSSPYEKYLNIIGASSWENTGQYIEWEFEAPQDGLYQIAVKYRQSINIGMTSYRRILIDGEVPYSELEMVNFPYSVSYSNRLLSDENGDAMAFFLTKGKHTIRMEVVIGELASVLPYLEDVVVALNTAYRNIIMITGSNPDTLRDYRLEEVIPDTIKSLDEQRVALETLCNKVTEIIGGGSSGTKIMGTVYNQLFDFVDDPYNLTSSLADFKSNISSLSTWLIDAKTQPLSIDYITVSGLGQQLESAKPSFLKSLKFNIQAFLYTFTDVYRNHSGSDEVITVWISSGTAQHAIVKQLIDAFYKEKDGYSVEVKLVTTSLISAIIAGKAPDISFGAASEAVMNYAFRKSVVDVARFSDFEQVSRRFRQSAFESVTYEDSVYAVPLTQTFPMMFYRTDVLEELNIQIPNDWDGVISAMAALKKKNLEFGIPSDINSYLTLLFQKGGTLYNDERSASTVTDYSSIEAFTEFSSWFTEYKSPISYNALQRFRTGEMPLLITDYTMYNNIDILAPEIKNLWGMAMIPGTEHEGELDRSAACTGTYAIILNDKKKDAAWELIKWWTSVDTQVQYAKRLEMALGQSGRYNTANLEAFNQLGYSADVREILNRQGDFTIGVPNAPGGYYVSRYLSNALNKVLYQGETPANALHSFTKVIDDEIQYKREEFGLDD